MKKVDFRDFYRRPDWYDQIAERYTEDIPYYVELAKDSDGSVLELACGNGRVGIPVIESEVEYYGIDITESMLKHFKEKAEARCLTLKLFHQDIRLMEFDREFGLIYYPYTAIAHIHEREDLRILLGRVRKHLNDKGTFAFDLFNPSIKLLDRDSGEHFPVHEFVDPESGDKVIVTETVNYDKASQINYVLWHYNIGGKEDAITNELNIRVFYPQEMDFIMESCGFEIVHKYGWFDKSPFESDSKRMVYICRKN